MADVAIDRQAARTARRKLESARRRDDLTIMSMCEIDYVIELFDDALAA